MNIFSQYKEVISRIVYALFTGLEGQELTFTVEPPKDVMHGDLATNIALVVNKRVGLSTAEAAAKIASLLKSQADVISVDIAGPGFINMRLNPRVWCKQIEHILDAKETYGDSTLGAGQVINIEFVSCNPTGPMHIGHARGGIYGDCLARIMKKVGFNVVKEFYINDAGSQIITLVRSAYIRYLQALGCDVAIPEGCYPGEYLIPVAAQLVEKFQGELRNIPEEEMITTIRDIVVNAMLDLIKADLKLIGIEFDIFISEKKELHDNEMLPKAIEVLNQKGLVYQGVLEAPKGKLLEDWEPNPQTIFKSVDFGDDTDRPLIKANGQYTYFAGDVAYHYNKLSRGYNNMILVLGADHSGYVKRISAAVEALSNKAAHIDVKITQMVNLLKNGQAYKMSKRAGNFVTVGDMVEEIGSDITRFMMLTRKGETVLDLDFALAKEETKENPVFYVQYAHARAASVLRKAEEQDLQTASPKFELLVAEEEIGIIKKMAQWPRILESSAMLHEPHRITYYLHELSNQFHGLWSRGTEEEEMRFIIEGKRDLSAARIALVRAVKYTIASGLDVIGVRAMERM